MKYQIVGDDDKEFRTEESENGYGCHRLQNFKIYKIKPRNIHETEIEKPEKSLLGKEIYEKYSVSQTEAKRYNFREFHSGTKLNLSKLNSSCTRLSPRKRKSDQKLFQAIKESSEKVMLAKTKNVTFHVSAVSPHL